MAQDIRFIVLNSDEALSGEWRRLLLGLDGIKILAEVEEPALLPQAVKQFPVQALLVNLGLSPDVVLAQIDQVLNDHPEVIIFAASDSTDGQLILKTMRAGVREFLPIPIEKSMLVEAVNKIATHQTETTKLGKIITVMGAAGGMGASMLATNLATELVATTGGKVTVVDLDYRFGQVAMLLDVEPTFTLADLCQSPEHLEIQVIERALVKHPSGLAVLSRPPSFTQADQITAASCVGVLSTLQQFNDYIVVDGPLRSDTGAQNILDISDVNLMVVQLLVPTVRNAARIIEVMRDNGYNLDRTKLVCNRVGRDSSTLQVDDVVSTLSKSVFAEIPDDWQSVSGAINLGETLESFSPKSKVRAAIREIAEQLHDPSSQSDDKYAPKKGLMGRIFSNA